MATNKETMKVIANGIDKKRGPEVIMEGKVITVEVPDNQEHDEWEPTETQELASDIAFEVAERTGEKFVRLMEGNDPELVMGMLKTLERSFYRSDVYVLRTLFLISEMKDAARTLDLLDICYEYDEAVYDLFHDYFFVSEGITDYCQQYYEEKEKRDNSPNSKLN